LNIHNTVLKKTAITRPICNECWRTCKLLPSQPSFYFNFM